MNVENAGLVALFGVECFAWFCGGEIIGRGFTFTGYYVWEGGAALGVIFQFSSW